MTQTKSLSFTTTVHGTQLRADISVTPRTTAAVTEEQLEFARELTTHLMDVTAEYQPEEATRNESLDAYVVLAHAFQVLDLARASVESRPRDVREYFWRLASDLEVLQAWDPRFTAAYTLARHGEMRAGDFDIDGIEELCEAIETWMPQRYAGKGFTPRRVVVDDHQSADDFLRTRTPDHTAVSVKMVEDAELPEEDYAVTARSVLPVPMFPDGTLDTRADVRSLFDDFSVLCTFRTDREDFPLLRSLSSAAEVATTVRRGHTPLEFYTELAYAKQLCWLARRERFAEDGVYRHKLLDELYPALIVVSLFGEHLAMPKYLAKLAGDVNEDLGSDAVLRVADVIDAWLPRDVRELVPSEWDDELDQQLPESLVAGLNALPGRRFIAVLDDQPAEEFEATGMPDKGRLNPVDLGPEVDPEVLSMRGVQVFRSRF